VTVRIGIVDSGVHAGHPLVGSIAGGVVIAGEDLDDHLGHGTAVAATIRQLAPDAELYIVKIFDRSLACPAATLLRGLAWCIDNRMDLVNLSLGTCNDEHQPALVELVRRAVAGGIRIVAPAGSLPGDLEGVIAVEGSAQAGSLKGSSFAVARATGELASKISAQIL
jgi:subtilisin